MTLTYEDMKKNLFASKEEISARVYDADNIYMLLIDRAKLTGAYGVHVPEFDGVLTMEPYLSQGKNDSNRMYSFYTTTRYTCWGVKDAEIFETDAPGQQGYHKVLECTRKPLGGNPFDNELLAERPHDFKLFLERYREKTWRDMRYNEGGLAVSELLKENAFSLFSEGKNGEQNSQDDLRFKTDEDLAGLSIQDQCYAIDEDIQKLEEIKRQRIALGSQIRDENKAILEAKQKRRKNLFVGFAHSIEKLCNPEKDLKHKIDMESGGHMTLMAEDRYPHRVGPSHEGIKRAFIIDDVGTFTAPEIIKMRQALKR